MYNRLVTLYDRIVLGHPLIALSLVVLLVAVAGFHARDFKLDASADSLVLENDRDLVYYRAIKARYPSDDYLILTYSPREELFTPQSLADLAALRASLAEIERVEAIVSILDVPLIDSPRLSLSEVQEKVRTLQDPDTDIGLAQKEFLTSPLYRNLILSPDGKTTALQVNFRRDETYHSLLAKRNSLRERQLQGELSAKDASELASVSASFDAHSEQILDREAADIATVRAIMERHRPRAQLHLGGVPMIVADMIDFIRHDLAAFGVGVLCFLVTMLALIFRKPRWVILPMACCFAAVIIMFGYLGFTQWRVTVVSSNFTSLMLIITLSLTVHLIVRYNELFAENPGATQRTLVLETMRSKAIPSIYTALTTMVAFASLLFSDIRPVIDFGWIMAVGVSVAFALSYILFPVGLVLLKPARFEPRFDVTGALTRWLARSVEHHGKLTTVVFLVIAVGSVIGISRLSVENRFIDHFKKTTEIYQGMELIDLQLGGTTPLEIIVDADADFLAHFGDGATDGEADDELDEELLGYLDEDFGEGPDEAGLSGTSFWYNTYSLGLVREIHAYLDGLPESGKVLSMATTMDIIRQLNGDKPLDNISLSVIHKKVPPEIRQALFDPYMSADGNQLRFAMRVFESNPSLRRNELLDKIRLHLVESLGLLDEQVHMTGMFVLYNNVLQSLYRSQILTIGAVFLAIMVMFLILFRSLRLALLAIVPNLLAAGAVLGLMGWLGIPLDIMTITIAAITIGIAVDDTIHYVHRFVIELRADGDRLVAMKRCHASVGRAMYYTSITVITGFSILALSNFIPTIYFGLFTGLAMAVAMFANLSLLALLLVHWGPKG